MTDKRPEMDLDWLGDFCYLAVAKDIPYPLNLPSWTLADGEEAIFQRAQWPIPFHLDDGAGNGWPMSELHFDDKMNCVWPLSLMKPALGEIRFVNWCMSFLADKVAQSATTYIAVAKAAGTERLNRELAGYKYLITFYGVAFDVPFLFRCFPGVRFDIPHFDLCFSARRLGIQGGLKKLETLFGIEREDAVRGMNGYDAVKLWGHAERGSSEALDLLLIYNREDTANLMRLADILYRKLWDSTGIGDYLAHGRA